MTVTSVLRSGLLVASCVTTALAAWLGSVVLFVLPARDPGHVQLWAGVTIGAAALAGLSLAATRRPGEPPGPSPVVRGLMLGLALVALAFGLIVVASFATSPPGSASEGYLLVVGAILAIHGALGTLWAAASLPGGRSRTVRSGTGR